MKKKHPVMRNFG